MNFRFTLSNDTLGAYILPSDPIGWDKARILFKRSPKYHGVFYEQNIDLQFLCNAGKEYIEQARALGIDTLVTLNIEIACGCVGSSDAPDYSIDYSDDYGSAGSDSCVYEQFYDGKLELKTCSVFNNKLSVNIIQNSITDTVINRMDTPIDLSKLETLDGTAIAPFTYGPYEMDLHSKAIVLLSELSTDEDIQDDEDVTQSQLSAGLATPIILPVTLNELDTIDSYSNFIYSGFISSTEPDTLFTASTNGIHLIEYDLSGIFSILWVNGGSGFTCDLQLEYRVNGVRTIIHDFGVITGGSDLVRNVSFNEVGSFNLNLTAGQRVSVYFYIFNFTVSVGSTGTNTITQKLNADSFIRFSTETLTEDTTAKVHAIFETGAGIFRSLTDQLDVFRSSYYGRKNSEPYAYAANGCGSFRSISNGALIRNFPIADRPVRITGNEYFDSLNAIDNMGMGIERIAGVDYVVMEPKSHFYSDTLLFRLTNVPDMRISEAPEYYHNRFECGYDKWQIEQKGGLDEFNSKRQYDLGLKTIDNPLVQVSGLIGSGYMLEIARRKQYPDSFTEDAETDNDNFIICLNKSVDGSGVPNNLTTAEKDENFTQVNDMLSPETSYNLDITPARNTLRWSPVLNVGLLKYPGRNYKFVYGEGNFKMSSQMTASDCPGSWNNELLAEGQDIQSDDANNTDNNPLWIPLTNTFKFPLTRAQALILQNNPNGYIEVSSTDTNYTKWYILEADYAPIGGMTEFKTLMKWQ